MLTLQHSLVTLFANNGDEKKFAREIAYVLIPDAIRKYCGQRQYSHFEKNPANGDTSWLQYPSNLKQLNKENADKLPKHLSDGIIPCAIGEEIDINSFEAHNKHLPDNTYFGIKKHLVQDRIFDEWIRKQIDCRNKYDGRFAFQGKEYDEKSTRELITNIERQGIYILAYMIHKSYGITVNQEWFDTHVKGVLDASYPQDLSNATYQRMTIPTDINQMISEHDWSGLRKGIIPLARYVGMYKQVVLEMRKIDFAGSHEERRKVPQEIEDR